jgi:SHAQKYF class myb-like DNA-binding protein
MSIDGMDNLNLSFIFSQDLNDIFLPTNYDNIPNELLFESKEELPLKQSVKFILTKPENPSVSLLQKKTIQKPTDSNVDIDNSNNGRWTKEEQKRFAEAVLKYGNDWKNIQSYVASRNITQVRSHAQKFLMKLKESNFLKERGLDSNLSWTKVINFLTNNLTNAELKEVLFSVEQTSNKKIEIKNYKNLKKIQKKKIKKKNSLEEEKETNSKIMNDSNAQSDNTCYSCKYNSYGKNYNSDYDEDYNIKQKIIKQEEDEILQKLIECFNNSYGENTQNSSFEENSIKEDGNDNRFNFLNEIQNK